MKKTWLLSLVLVATAIVGFACGGDDATPTTRPTATSPAPTATSQSAPDATATSAAPTATTQPVVDPTATVPAPSNGGSVTLEIASASSDDLMYASESLTASAGAEVTLTFSNNANTQQHNWVLVQDGTKDTVASAGLLAGPASDWVSPDDANVIANTKLANAGETARVQFTAPAAGTYQFVCTFPGHSPSMFGTFEVTP